MSASSRLLGEIPMKAGRPFGRNCNCSTPSQESKTARPGFPTRLRRMRSFCPKSWPRLKSVNPLAVESSYNNGNFPQTGGRCEAQACVWGILNLDIGHCSGFESAGPGTQQSIPDRPGSRLESAPHRVQPRCPHEEPGPDL